MGYNEWMKSASKDLLSQEALIKAKQYEKACVIGHQAVEKALKGFLAYKDESAVNTHNIKALLEKCKEHEIRLYVLNSAVEELYKYLCYKYPDQRGSSKWEIREAEAKKAYSMSKTVYQEVTWHIEERH